MKKLLLTLLLFSAGTGISAAKTYDLKSPDGKIAVRVDVGADAVTYSISRDGKELIAPSPLSLTLADGRVLGRKASVRKASAKSVDEIIEAPFYKRSAVEDRYNSLTLTFKGDYGIDFRAYDDGVAYRFVSRAKKPFNIVSEQAEYRFPADCAVTVPYVRDHAGNIDAQWRNSFENTYTETTLSKLDAGRLIFLPLVVDAGDGMKVCITETDLNDYPGMYLWNGDGGQHLTARFAPYPKRTEQGGYNNLQMVVKEREAFIAKVEAPRTFPWRVAIVGTDPDLAASDLRFLLAAPSKIDDTSWIKPGKVAWDWWNAWNISGVDFRAGINTETYKYYIDFAAAKGIEYVILDEGWAVNKKADLMQIVPEIDLPAIVEYGRQKGVGIILWMTWLVVENHFEMFEELSKWGVKGVKIDFMDRSDQWMVNYYERVTKCAADHHIFVDWHGSYTPKGLFRTYPNLLTYEAVLGMEQGGRCKPDNSNYLPFIRNAVGPMDFTPGGMFCSQPEDNRSTGSNPMASGTRAYQLALYVVFESPLQMMADNPVYYYREHPCTEFIASVPTTWDELRVLRARCGEQVVMARRKGDRWFIGGITNNQPYSTEVALDFLPAGRSYTMTSFEDGVNADLQAMDYKKRERKVDASTVVKIDMVRNGGWAAVIE